MGLGVYGFMGLGLPGARRDSNSVFLLELHTGFARCQNPSRFKLRLTLQANESP